jgi:hypothetical protein
MSKRFVEMHILFKLFHRAYPVTQECAINVKVTPNLCNAIAQTNNTVSKRTKIFYSKSNLKK